MLPATISQNHLPAADIDFALHVALTSKSEEVKQAIVGFDQDEVGDWRAILACGHRQHVRHNPPFETRPWVLTKAGRSRFLGCPLQCVLCDEESEGTS